METTSVMEKHIRAMVEEMFGEAQEAWVVTYGDDTDSGFTEITKVCLSHGDAAIDFVRQHHRAKDVNNQNDDTRRIQANYADICSVNKDCLAEILKAVMGGQSLPGSAVNNRGITPVYFGENAFASFKQQTSTVQSCSIDLQNLLNRSIEEVEFSVRTYNALKRGGVETICDLIQWEDTYTKPNGIMSIQNLGRKSLKEIEGILDALGLTLGMTVTSVNGSYQLRRKSGEIITELSPLHSSKK